MLKFHGVAFYALGDSLGTIQGAYQIFTFVLDQVRLLRPNDAIEVNLKGLEKMKEPLQRLRPLLEEIELPLSIDSFDRLRKLIETADLTPNQIRDNIIELQGRIRDELSHIELWLITKEESRFLKTDPFGPEIPNKFAPARDDIEEAGKCLAYARGTACVFHLMRVMEVGLRALGASLNDPRLDPKRNPSWDSILKKCDDELSKRLQDRCAEWQQDDAFYSTAAAQLHAVKDAWRNPTMHVERKYTPEEAEEVWNAVRGFMRHLAKRLDASVTSQAAL
jgi:hypothetical protein